MGPNNGENQSGGVSTLEAPQVAPAATEAGNGLLPTPGAASAEASGVMAQAEDVAVKALSGSEAASTAPATVPEAAAPTTAGLPEVKPLDSTKPFVSPDMASASATVANRDAQQEAFVAQQSKEKTGWGNKILNLVGLKGGARTVTVGQPENATPDHLKDGVTPPVPNVTPEAAAAVNQEPVKLSSTEMDAAMKQGAMDGKAILEPAPDSLKTPATEAPAVATQEGLSPMGTDVPAAPTAEPSVSSSSMDTPAASVENTGMDAANAVKEADDIVKNAAGTDAALDEIDKTATDAMDTATSPDAKPDDVSTSGTAASSSEAFPSYGVQTEAGASSATGATPGSTPDGSLTTTAPSVEASSAWPSAPATEPTTSGPSAVAEPPAAPIVPEYKPTTDMAPAGEAAAPTTPASWSFDATAAHPDAPVVGGAPSAPEAPSPLPSPEPNALNLEASPTPMPGAPTETPPPFGTGMPPVAEAAPPTIAAPDESLASSPTNTEPPVEPLLGSASASAAVEPPPMNVLEQAGQVAASTEVSEGALPTDGAVAPAIENPSSAMTSTAESSAMPSGNVLEQTAAVAESAGASTLGAPQEASSMVEPTLSGAGAPTNTVEPPTGSGTNTPPLATS